MSDPIVDVVVHCPKCGLLHLDEGEWRDRPHRKHLCLACGEKFYIPGFGTTPTRGVYPCSLDPRCVLPTGHAPDAQSGGCLKRDLSGESW